MKRNIFNGSLFLILCLHISCGPGHHMEASRPEVNQVLQSGDQANELLRVAVDYADFMVGHGRDVYGREPSPLFASALSRSTMELDPGLTVVEIAGVR